MKYPNCVKPQKSRKKNPKIQCASLKSPEMIFVVASNSLRRICCLTIKTSKGPLNFEADHEVLTLVRSRTIEVLLALCV